MLCEGDISIFMDWPLRYWPTDCIMPVAMSSYLESVVQHIYIYIYARDISISYRTVIFMSNRSVHVCPTKRAHMYVSWEYESNSVLAQDQSILVDKAHNTHCYHLFVIVCM